MSDQFDDKLMRRIEGRLAIGHRSFPFVWQFFEQLGSVISEL